ncbi:MAG: hypothetical protein HY243_12290 [Proteobacteria bacterium]|nr:hypothetical protein [Pseudomonadota bacterium]
MTKKNTREPVRERGNNHEKACYPCPSCGPKGRKKTQVAAGITPTPVVLLPYQQRWLADQSDVKVCEKSRRVGISWAEASEAVLYSAVEVGGDDTHYIGYNHEMAREFINDCATWARHFQKAAGAVQEFLYKDEDKDILSYRINFASGHEIVAHSSRPKNLRGKHGVVVIDEAAFHDDLEGLKAAAIALLMWGGKLRIISTHFGEDNPFNSLVKEIRERKWPYSLHRITFDDALTDGLYKRICLVQGKEWSQEAEVAYRQGMMDKYGESADEELFCIPSKGSGSWIPQAAIEQCMDPSVPVVRLECPADFALKSDDYRTSFVRQWLEENVLPLAKLLDKNQNHYFGEDFGRTGDLTVFWPLAEEKMLRYRTPFVIELGNVPFRQQEEILFALVDALPRFCGGAMDARGNGQALAEFAMQRYGERVQQVMLTAEFYRENCPPYKAALEDRTIIMPKSSDVLNDHRQVVMERGVASISDGGRQKGTDGKQRHADTFVAAMLAWFARSKPYQPVEYTSALRRKADGGEPVAGASFAHDDDYHVERGYGHHAGASY